jgi:STE24 endopeptidase
MAAVAMVVVAEAAVWLLRPRESVVDPVPVSESDYFTHAQIDRGRSYGDGQLLLFLAGLGAEGAVLVTVALGHPGAARRTLKRLGRRPILGGAAAGAGISLALGIAGLPAGIAGHERAVDYGISTQSLSSWLGDSAKSGGIGVVFAGAGGAIMVGLLRRFGRRWWIPGSVAAAAIATVMVWLAPVVLAPLFNRFEALPDSSRARADVLELGRRAGVDIGEVYRVDASRRVRSLNAYVTGIGPTKRVVLYDNLLRDAKRGELRSVVAHELGHVAHDDVPRGLGFLFIVAPFGLLFTRELAEAVAGRAGFDPRSPSALPAYALGLMLASLALGIVGNQLSRRIEAGADTFALKLTDDPRSLIEVQRRLAIVNVANPDPPDVVTALLGSHPPTIERIGAAVAFEREAGARSGSPGHH